ncbi:hypothetical protein SH1V18_20400 [Vallitalea longa]|uniref:Uncharacterized protein n=1 Tax=Vallitalea longa TaxID=2936439 RepID=A0A9W5Y971_9FIRM|nr:hypothetical protein [Vallitalea longa]GKX29560.1 hypothetical protein SH1V18_20400 [Vallitalea longa]
MEFANNIYIGEEISNKKANKIIKKLKRKKHIRDVYFLTCIEESRNPMEILLSTELYRLMDKGNNILIVGIAHGRDNAFELVRDIYDDVYTKCSNVDIESYFKTS